MIILKTQNQMRALLPIGVWSRQLTDVCRQDTLTLTASIRIFDQTLRRPGLEGNQSYYITDTTIYTQCGLPDWLAYELLEICLRNH